MIMNLFISTLLVINIAVVFITDCSDFPQALKTFIIRVLTQGKIVPDDVNTRVKIHLIDCSLCLTFHLGWIWTVIYSIWIGPFSVWYIALFCLLSFLTPVTANLIHLIKDSLLALIDVIYKKLN